jgi:hypothetical protein
MKTTPIPVLNTIGFTNAAQKVAYAALLLQFGTVPSPAVTLAAAIPAILAAAEVLAKPAYPARAASAAVAAAANTAGVAAGALYLNSPAYPAGTAIPAIPAKPATAAIIGKPAVVAVPAVPAIVAPAVTPIPGWIDAVSTVRTANALTITAYLPVATSPRLFGAATSTVESIKEITPPALIADRWLDAKASNVPETITAEPPTLEQYFYKYATQLSGTTVTDVVKLVNGVPVTCKKVVVTVAAANYDLTTEALQLGKLGI